MCMFVCTYLYDYIGMFVYVLLECILYVTHMYHIRMSFMNSKCNLIHSLLITK